MYYRWWYFMRTLKACISWVFPPNDILRWNIFASRLCYHHWILQLSWNPDRSLPFIHVRWATCISFSLKFAVLQVDWVLRGPYQYARRQHRASTRVHHPGIYWLKTGSLTLRLGIRWSWSVNAVAYLRLLFFSHTSTPGSAQKRR